MISCAWKMSKALCHRWYDAFGLHDPRMLSTSACSGCFCPKARVISHAISAWCAQRATPACSRLGTVDNSRATLENPACATGANPPASCVCSHTTFPRGARPFNFRSYCACTSRTMSARDSSCDDSMESIHGIFAGHAVGIRA